MDPLNACYLMLVLTSRSRIEGGQCFVKIAEGSTHMKMEAPPDVLGIKLSIMMVPAPVIH